MCKRFFITLFVVFCVTSIMPLCVFAEDSSSDSSTSEQSTLDGLGSDLNSAVEEHGNGILDAFNEVQNSWYDAIDGLTGWGLFLSDGVGSVLAVSPAITIYLILLCLVLAALGVLKALTSKG